MPSNTYNVKPTTSEEKVAETITKTGSQVLLGDSELNIPSGALLTPTELTISEVTTMGKLKDGMEFISGVEINAEDAFFMSPAEIIIPLPSAENGEQYIGYAYEESGNDFHLYPFKTVNGMAVFEVMHFSGYGIIQVSENFEEPPESPNVRNAARQNIFRVIIEPQSIQNRDGGLSEDQLTRIDNILRVWYKMGVKKELNKALENGDYIKVAAKELIIWKQAVQALGRDASFTAEFEEAFTLLNKAINKAVDTAYSKCAKEHDPSQVGRLMWIAGFVQALGEHGTHLSNADDIIQKARNCANFKLTIKSTFTTEDDPECGPEVEEYYGEIILNINDDFQLSGEGQMDGFKTKCHKKCILTAGTLKQTVRVPETEFKVGAAKDDISILLEIPEELIDTTLDCSYTVPGSNFELGMHETNITDWDEFILSHMLEKRGKLGNVLIKNWDIVKEGDVYARKVYDKKVVGMPGEREYSVLELIHTPK
ncbi:hypothetical protein ACFLZK_02890 [Patescibacteria group bacterium]